MKPSLPVFIVTVLLSALTLSVCGGGGGSGGDSRALWIFPTERGIDFAAPALSQDESTVYFGTSFGNSLTEDFGLYALDATTGDLVWKYHTGESPVRSAAVVDGDGAIYFVVDNRNSVLSTAVLDELIKVDSMGSFLWSFDINPSRLADQVKGSSSPAIGPDGTVYAAGDALYALSPDGTLKWSAGSSSEMLRSSPSVAAAGTIYLAYHNYPLKAFDPVNGDILWTVPGVPEGHCFSSPVVGQGGTVYLGTDGGKFYAVSPGGTINWTYDTLVEDGYAWNIRSSPAIGPDDTIYFGTSQGQGNSPSTMPRFYALDPDGSLRWYFAPVGLLAHEPDVTHHDFYSSPAVAEDGTVYTGHEFGSVYALDPADGSVKWTYDTYQAFTGASPAIKSDGTLFIGRIYGNLYALKTEGGGLNASSPWPKSRGDAFNTAQVLAGP